jgi:uroporphyrinogen decarboxylase
MMASLLDRTVIDSSGIDTTVVPANDLLLRACRREPVPRPPVWIMRQAGRYLAEYRRVREIAGDFVKLVRSPELAAEVTVQPVDLIGVDAAILFSDILVIPDAMGCGLSVEENVGPRLARTVRSAADLDWLQEVEPERDLAYVMDAIRACRRRLANRVPLIGFAGAPWTLAAYMIEGAGTKNFSGAKRLLMSDARTAHRLLERVADAVGRHLLAQVHAGAQVVQLFESWGGALSPDDFREFALPHLATAAGIARRGGAPVIVFAPGCGTMLEEIANATGADVLGVDWHTPAAEARRVADRCGVAIQGNLDPCALYAPVASVRDRTRAMLRAMHGPGVIANLGHGILPDTPVEGARTFVDTVQSWTGIS